MLCLQWTVDGKSKGKKGRVPLINRGRGIGRKMIMGHKPSSESSDDEEDGDSEEEMVSQGNLVRAGGGAVERRW